MKLELFVVKYRGALPTHRQNFIFGKDGGDIGRSAENTWALADTQNFLSRVQASISFQNNRFYIIDKSSNGCYLNQASMPIGKGNSQELNDNDTILMGEYELQVKYISQSSTANSTSVEGGLFGNLRQNIVDEGYADSLSPSVSAFSDSDPCDDIFRPKYKHENDYVKPEVDSSLNASSSLDMPVVENNTSPTFTQENPEHKKDELFANESSTNKAFSFDSAFKVDPKNKIKTSHYSEKKNVVPPVEQTTGHTEIFGANNKEPVIEVESPSLFQSNETKDVFGVDEDSAKTEETVPDPDIIKAQDIETVENSKASQQFSASVKSSRESQQASVPITEDNNEHQQSSINAKQPIAQQQNVLFEKILEGAGLDSEFAKTELSNESAVLIGKALRETLQGTMDLLRSRSETKNHMRLGGGDKTIISIAQNNPLKFLPNADHIMTEFILSEGNKNPAYMPLVDAIQASFDDLKAHQFALGMSIQEALSSTIHDYFSPENLQKKLEKSHPIGSKIPWQKNAKLWKLFEETYGDIEKEASETFQLVLEKKIADAYEANMMRLKQQRSVKQER